MTKLLLKTLLLLTAVQTYAETLKQSPEDLIDGEYWAVAYSGFREGQHPDRGDGAINPSAEEILEDLKILEEEGFRLIRMYDSGENTRMTLEVIRDNDLPITVCLGVWLDAEVSNHENCHWLTEPIPQRLWRKIRRKTLKKSVVRLNYPMNSMRLCVPLMWGMKRLFSGTII